MFSGMIPESVVKLGKMLVEWMPDPLQKSLFLNTGSESNEAALRLAKLTTGGYEPKGAGKLRDTRTKCIQVPDQTLPGQLR